MVVEAIAGMKRIQMLNEYKSLSGIGKEKAYTGRGWSY
jgi:hypothetical protein